MLDGLILDISDKTDIENQEPAHKKTNLKKKYKISEKF